MLQAIDNAQVDKLVQLAQMYGPEITRGAINQVGSTKKELVWYTIVKLADQRLPSPSCLLEQHNTEAQLSAA